VRYLAFNSKLLAGCSGGILLWYPFAKFDCWDEPGWSYLFDCFIAPPLGPTARLLLSRKVETARLVALDQPPLAAPILEPLGCSEEILNEIARLANLPAQPARSPPLFDYFDYAAARLLGSKHALQKLEKSFRNFVKPVEHLKVLAEAVKPERLKYAGTVYVLACIDARKRFFLLVGDEKVRSRLHEKYIREESLERLLIGKGFKAT
jgi:hypothetical protein